jgi:hypothetical protein
MPTANLFERVTSDSSRVDRASGVIRGVKIIGRVSKNNKEYSDDALNQAVGLYEGVSVFIDHPDRRNPSADRSVRDKFGELRNVRRQGDGVYGDLHYLKAHPVAEQVCESAERGFRIGLSHNAQGRIVNRGGRSVVESLECVRSVDVVVNPATNRSLFEQTSENTAGEIDAAILAAVRDTGLTRSQKLASIGELIDLAAKVEAALRTEAADDEQATGVEDVGNTRGVTSDENGKPTEPDDTYESIRARTFGADDGTLSESARDFISTAKGKRVPTREERHAAAQERRRHADFISALN